MSVRARPNAMIHCLALLALLPLWPFAPAAPARAALPVSVLGTAAILPGPAPGSARLIPASPLTTTVAYTITNLGIVGLSSSAGVALNDKGEAVGQLNGSPIRPFLWLPAPAYGLPAGLTDLASFDAEAYNAWDINNSGVIAGTIWLPLESNQGAAAWWWEAGTGQWEIRHLGALGAGLARPGASTTPAAWWAAPTPRTTKNF